MEPDHVLSSTSRINTRGGKPRRRATLAKSSYDEAKASRRRGDQPPSATRTNHSGAITLLNTTRRCPRYKAARECLSCLARQTQRHARGLRDLANAFDVSRQPSRHPSSSPNWTVVRAAVRRIMKRFKRSPPSMRFSWLDNACEPLSES